jgi:hypothetical protein
MNVNFFTWKDFEYLHYNATFTYTHINMSKEQAQSIANQANMLIMERSKELEKKLHDINFYDRLNNQLTEEK